MKHYLFNQLRFVRNNTMRQAAEIGDEQSAIVPVGFNNNIKWNLGHIYVAQEKFAFILTGETSNMPDHYPGLFGPGTKPGDWDDGVPPMRELMQLLESQTDRIEQALEMRLKDQIEQPYTTSTGLTLSTVEELLSFCLYHEGMHFDAIKTMKRLIRI
ncbi:DinB family protein [Paenibacillus sp. MSJ-34]|uniref:DinB family protein n=1 Tax=Paenibacillus sp. MSJ-34 TaxID=2841529 RepID=UPI001C0FEAE9|nr:DinB family protein [Paenibacillus sp. MSJ-34]MBU5441239.1 DinB family protein [Paenibacillus sp. MSJ-34]